MIIIQKEINVEKVLGFQSIDENVEYRKLNYVIKLKVDCGWLFFNTLTRGIVYFTFAEYENKDTYNYLIEHWYFVTPSFDDDKLFRQYKGFCRMVTPKVDFINSFVIFTTTDCNARCFYCFEKGAKREMMNKKTADDVVDYIVKHYGGHEVSIHWFGGEPLYNVDVIDDISNKLLELGIKFSSSMNSNGYLFDDDMVLRAKNKWNLKKCTITLDGTERVYNRIKAYIYKDTNAYKRVVNNIKSLINTKIFVTIRLNVHSENMDDLANLVNQLDLEFPDRKYLCIDPHPIYENTGSKRDNLIEVKNKIYSYTLELNRKIVLLGFHMKHNVKNFVSINKCMADSDNSIGILPNGDICKCEHFAGKVIGSIYNDNINVDVLNNCRSKFDDIPECKSCFFRPECFQLKICPSDQECTEYWRKRRYDRTKQLMLNTYNSFMRKESQPYIEYEN